MCKTFLQLSPNNGSAINPHIAFKKTKHTSKTEDKHTHTQNKIKEKPHTTTTKNKPSKPKTKPANHNSKSPPELTVFTTLHLKARKMQDNLPTSPKKKMGFRTW